MQQTNDTCKYTYKSHDTVQVMQAYLLIRMKKRTILEQHTFQLEPGKESKYLRIKPRPSSFGLASVARVDFHLKSLQLLILRK